MVLRAEDVATAPANVGTEFDERLDQDGGLNGHVQRADDASAFERLLGGVLAADRHQPGHFLFSQFDFFATKVGEGQICDFKIFYGNGHV